ncbi:hypothetical protein [Bombella apis]|uniref:hypothetical protein n=1 Tax=Bombella apis TaxID=1785988 RepID=UPI0012B9BA91|nr:hypothetical protein [Bombella apis]MPV99812.1 hypothetical protein [Bombella apis]
MTQSNLSVTAPERSFTRKQISVTFDVALPGGGIDSVTLEGAHRIRATIKHAGMSLGSELALTIEGMSWRDMNRLSFVENRPNVTNPTLTNQSSTTVTVRAGTYGKALPTVFHGNVFKAYASFNGGSAIFTVVARTISLLTKTIPPAISYRGPRNVVSILSDICLQAGITLADHGGWGSYATICNHYGEGTSLDQIVDVIEAVGATCDFVSIPSAQDERGQSSLGVLHVWGPNYDGSREPRKAETPLIGPETGMIGYPEYSATGLVLNCLFRPDITFNTPIYVQSSQIPAGWLTGANGLNQQGQAITARNAPWNGTWTPRNITHDISSETLNGPWMTTAECQRTDLSNPYAFSAK